MFKIGSPVYATDGRIGTLQYVVLNPHNQEISDLVVKCDLFTGSRVIPARFIQRVEDDGGIHLSVEKAVARRMREFRHEEFELPANEAMLTQHDSKLYWMDPYGVTGGDELPKPLLRVHVDRGVDDDDILIGKGSRVFTALGERVGVIDHVVVDKDANKLLYLVVRLPGIRRRRVVVAASQVKAWQHDAVTLNLDKDALLSLPPYVPAKRDDVLAQLVRQAIEALGAPIENLGVYVDNGHVLLRGHCQSQDDRRRIEAAARAVSGVISVTNEIDTDKHLEVLLQQRLLDDPVAGNYPVDVIIKNRIATVIGKAPSQAVKDIILEVVRNTPGVISVIDDISVDATAFEDAFSADSILDSVRVVPGVQEP